MSESNASPQPLDKLQSAKRHVNRVRMEDNAYRYVYRNAVFHPLRILLVSLLKIHTGGNAKPFMFSGLELHIVDIGVIKRKLGEELGITSSNTQERHVKKAIKIGLISKLYRGEGPNGRKAYTYFTEEQLEKFSELLVLFEQIDRTITRQIAEPDNPIAGREFVPDEVYYNIDGDLRV